LKEPSNIPKTELQKVVIIILLVKEEGEEELQTKECKSRPILFTYYKNN
jgi:hypothetical protein